MSSVSSAIGSIPITRSQRIRDLQKLRDIKIKRVLIQNFGEIEGEKYFQIYKDTKPAPLRTSKKRLLARIPSGFLKKKLGSSADQPLHLPNGKKFFQVIYDFNENEKGEIEFWEKNDPLTKKKLFDHIWFKEHKKACTRIDKDGETIFRNEKNVINLDVRGSSAGSIEKDKISLAALDLAKTKSRVSEKPKKISCFKEIVQWIVKIVKCIFAFFKNCFSSSAPIQNKPVNNLKEPVEEPIVIACDEDAVSSNEEYEF